MVTTREGRRVQGMPDSCCASFVDADDPIPIPRLLVVVQLLRVAFNIIMVADVEEMW